jgi:hypothetical protein
VSSIARLAAVAACAVLAPAAAQRDRTAPVFAGLRSATTCIPGPVGDGRTSIYHLVWVAARDSVTPRRRLGYLVFQTTSSGGESYSRPSYTTPLGATSFATPPLSSNVSYYFVVRARDAAGNIDHNRQERRGANLCV